VKQFVLAYSIAVVMSATDLTLASSLGSAISQERHTEGSKGNAASFRLRGATWGETLWRIAASAVVAVVGGGLIGALLASLHRLVETAN
jgi:hypothetical protein